MENKKYYDSGLDLTVSKKQVIIYLALNIVVVLTIAILNGKGRDFDNWLLYGYFWSFPVALFSWVVLVYRRNHELTKDEEETWSEHKITSQQEDFFPALAEVWTKEIAERRKMAKRQGIAIKPVSILPPVYVTIPYIILALIAVYAGAYIEAGDPDKYRYDYIYEREFNTISFIAGAFTLAAVLIIFGIRKLASLPRRKDMGRKEAEETYGAKNWATDQDIDNALK